MAMEERACPTLWLGFGLAMAWLCAGRAHAAVADNLVAKVQAATYEVVVPKPNQDPLVYEKPLPLDAVPFQERNDKYFSVGTAFALGNNQYVTAAHVLNLAVGGLTEAPELRDRDGHVYAISQITKYSLEKDFAVFSLASQPPPAALAINEAPQLNSKVYAVGNALGTGVVMRDGLYTSDTPEDQSGRWNWMRFSAAASPGNSGGPLLDGSGQVIGVVLMKSANENLNFALPIREVVNASDHDVDIDKKLSYRPNFIDAVETASFKANFPLPKSFADFSDTYQKNYDAFYARLQQSLLDHNAAELFPHGDGSQRLLHASADMHAFPSILVRDSAGTWVLKNPPHDHRELSGNGYVDAGKAGSNVLLTHLRRPDEINADQLYRDPKRFMDLLLKGWEFNRAMGNEKVRIVSLGAPRRDSIYTDSYQRRWQVRVWPVAYNNLLVVTFSLPVPDGYVTVMELAPANNLGPAMGEMQTQCDYIDAAYAGSLTQWKSFLAEVDLLPSALSDVHLSFEEGKRFSFKSPDLGLVYGADLMDVSQNSVLDLGFVFSDNNGKVRWELADVGVKAQAGEAERVNVSRHVAPIDPSAPGAAWWPKLRQRQHPDDGTVFTAEGESRIGTLVGDPPATSAVLYRATYATSGTAQPGVMKAKFEQLLKGITIKGT